MGCVLYELYMLRSPFAGPGMNYYMLGHKLLRFASDFVTLLSTVFVTVHCWGPPCTILQLKSEYLWEAAARHAVHITSQHISRHFSSLQKCKLLDAKCASNQNTQHINTNRNTKM